MAKSRGTSGTPKRRSDWQSAFLAALRDSANVRHAAQCAGVGRRTVYRRLDDDEAFRAAYDAAMDDAVDELEMEARRRAARGVVRLKFHQGNPIMVPRVGSDGAIVIGADGEPEMVPYLEHEYSDVLMIFLLKAHRPEKYRDNLKLDVSGEVTLRRYVGIDPEQV